MRYQVDESPPLALALGVGMQSTLLAVINVVVISAIVIRTAGGSDAYLSWATFAALVICGLVTTLQSAPVGRIGSGYVLTMAASQSFIAISVTAIAVGGPGMFAVLVLISSLLQFALGARLALFRRVLTPTVVGTTVMLVTVTVMPIIFDLLTDVPAGTDGAAAPVVATTTFVTLLVLVLRAPRPWRIWTPVIAIFVGCIVSAGFGLYEVEGIIGASWFGLPELGWPGWDFGFGVTFWSLLPAFVFVALVDGMATCGDAIVIQRVSWRQPRATDYRAVQGAVSATGLSTLLSGLAGTVPNKVHVLSVGIAEITGVTARRVGVCGGIIFLVAAFLPKISALLQAIPNPVIAAYTIVFMGILFSAGVRIIVTQSGLDYRKATVAGVSFWIGMGFQNGWILADSLGRWNGLLGNGITTGGLTAILLTMAMGVSRSRDMETDLEMMALSEIRGFLGRLCARQGWGPGTNDRLCLAAEETLLTLVRQDETRDEARRLRVAADVRRDAIDLEFVAAVGGTNIADRIAVLEEAEAEMAMENAVSLRLLRHLSSSVSHRQYHDTDIVTVRIKIEKALRRS